MTRGDIDHYLERLRRAEEKRERGSRKDVVKLDEVPRQKPEKKRLETDAPGGHHGVKAEAAEETVDRPRSEHRSYAVLITALAKEKVKATRSLGQRKYTTAVQGIYYDVHGLRVDDEAIDVALCCINEMGMVPAAITALKAIQTWSPRYVCMSGICAGVSGKTAVGDLVLAEEVFDYGSGKILPDGRLHPDYKPIRLSDAERNVLHHFVEHNLKLQSLREEWPTEDVGIPDTPSKARIGSFASGAAVVAKDSVVVDVESHKRNLLGIDMEAFGVARAVTSDEHGRTKFLIVKGVSDYADHAKNDNYQEYCAFLSAACIRDFLRYRVRAGEQN